MRNWHYYCASGDRQARAAALVLAFLADRNTRAFREHDNPLAIGQAAFAMRHHASERVLALLAVDRDHAQQRHRPTKKRDIQNLFLEHVDQRTWQARQEEDGFPRRLVLRQYYRRHVREILGALDFVAYATNDLGTQIG